MIFKALKVDDQSPFSSNLKLWEMLNLMNLGNYMNPSLPLGISEEG
jgi:hypothetical protein